MAASNAITGSKALIDLKDNLSSLSTELHKLYDLMYDNMRNVGDFWQDAKYNDFVDGYAPQIKKCDEIAVRYEDWCKKVLQPTIDKVIEVEQVNVSI